MKTLLPLGLAAVLLSACVYPVQQTKVVDARPTISVNGAPAGSVLLVDGLNMGDPSQLASGKGELRLESGTHVVSIESPQGQVLLNQRIYLSDGLHKDLNVGN